MERNRTNWSVRQGEKHCFSGLSTISNRHTVCARVSLLLFIGMLAIEVSILMPATWHIVFLPILLFNPDVELLPYHSKR